jgi:c-di-GMP-binding flagellar brake protein YcgR
MSNSTSERRLARRYSLNGPVSVRFPNGESEPFSTDVFDISLNGALLGAPPGASLTSGMQLDVVLDFPDMPQVIARAAVAHVREAKFGVEFSDMETRDFAVFSGLVLMLEQRNRLRMLTGD